MLNTEQVVRLCQEGQLDAFDTLFNHFRTYVYDLALTIMLDETTAEDVVQDSFLAVFQNIDGFKGESVFKTWLTTIVVNQCRMRQRRAKLRSFLSIEQLSPRRLLRLSHRQADVADKVHIQQRSQAIWDAVDQLQERLRLPLILHYRYTLSCSDIASILNLRTSTIYKRLYEGRRQLKEKLEEHENFQPQTLAGLTD